MHTEQDTIDRLRRIPFEDMRQLVVEFNDRVGLRQTGMYDDLYRLMADNGWGLEDYHKGFMSYFNRVHVVKVEEQVNEHP